MFIMMQRYKKNKEIEKKCVSLQVGSEGGLRVKN